MTNTPVGIVMLATKFYARSDMGGGLEQSARRLFRQLLDSGYRLVVLTRNYDGLAKTEVIDSVTVHRVSTWGRSRALASASYLILSLWWLLRHRHDYGIIHCHQSYGPATVGACGKLLLGKPVVVKVSTADEFSEVRELERLPLFRLRRWLLKRVDRFVVVNRLARKEFAELGIDTARIVHIPNGVSIPSEAAYIPSARHAARERLGISWKRVVLFVGRLSTEKNIATLIDAWPLVLRSHPDAHLLVVGDGGTFRSAEAALRSQVEAMALQASVHFVGRVSDVSDFLLAADVFVLPSSTEGMSNALLEAMAAGLAIVTTRIPGNTELIREGQNGVLVETLDVTGLARAIVRLLESPEAASLLGEAARRTAQEQFAIQRITRQYSALYNELLH